MSIYMPNYTKAETTAMTNCLCGDSGRSRNDKECARKKNCEGCGFDRNEHERRIAILRSVGLKKVPPMQMDDLAVAWGVNRNKSLFRLEIGKKK